MERQKPIDLSELRTDGVRIDRPGKEKSDANIKINVEKGLPAFKRDTTPKGRVAIVGYGPSLLHTWERLKDFDTIWTVSKAHDFLLTRGIVPTYHTEIDMRAHKVAFMRYPDKRVKYVMATQVWPTFFDKLAGCDVRLFHSEVEKRQPYDPRYPRSRVRFDAGLQAAELAFWSGHREQHWFGIEYGTPAGQTHAGPHEGVKQTPLPVLVGGVEYLTSNMFVHGLFLGEHLLCQRPLLRCTIHGDGLLARFLLDRRRVKIEWIP